MTLTADGTGKVLGKFIIPANVPAGTKLVQFQGRAGSKANASFTGRGQITQRELRGVTTITTIITDHYERYDPQAETFTLGAAALVSGVDIWFCAKGSSGRTLVEIRETGNGVPTQDVVASAVMQTSALLTGQWQRFTWDPVRLEPGREYAIVVGCDDATTALAIAELGKFDPAAQAWVTQQPYQVGVRLSSSNGSTWTPHQESDIAFRLLMTPLAASTATIALPPVAVTGCDELIILAAVDRPTADCDCTFRLTLPDGTILNVGEGERVLLPATVTGTIQWAAILTGSIPDAATPLLWKDIQMVWGTRSASAIYISRALPAGAASKISVYYESLLPGIATVQFDVAQDGVGTGGWTNIPLIASTQIGDGWEDRTNRLAVYNPTLAVIRCTITGNARARPEIRKLRVVVT